MVFIRYLNSIYSTIKFSYKISLDSIESLDVMFIRDKNTIHTDISVKETDIHQFLHFFLVAIHLILKREFLTVRLLGCATFFSREHSYKNRISDIKNWLYSWCYEKELADFQEGIADSLYKDKILD